MPETPKEITLSCGTKVSEMIRYRTRRTRLSDIQVQQVLKAVFEEKEWQEEYRAGRIFVALQMLQQDIDKFTRNILPLSAPASVKDDSDWATKVAVAKKARGAAKTARKGKRVAFG